MPIEVEIVKKPVEVTLEQNGPPGPKGYKGDTGIKGDTGVKGDTGISVKGDTGLQGIKGDTGSKGNTGTKGDTGISVKGDTGSTGIQGAKGDTGIKGNTGSKGDTGISVKGDTGANSTVKGDTGTKGDTGFGLQGNTGTQGLKGNTGSQGATGTQGNTGVSVKGDTGSQGIKGDTGTQGLAGNTGIKGDTGLQGNTGADSTVQGPQGDTGIEGGTGSQGLDLTYKSDWLTDTQYYVNDAVTANGNIYICIQDHVSDNGDFEPEVGVDWTEYWSRGVHKGDTGNTGLQGDTGLPGADAVAGKLPSAYVELETPQGTTSATLEDVSGMTTTITLEEAVEISVIASFEIATQSGASASVLGIAININGTDYDSYQRYLSGSNDVGIGAITHRSGELPAGTYTIKLRFQRISGIATPGLNKADMLVMAMQGAKGEKGDTGIQGLQGNTGIQGTQGNTGIGTKGDTGSKGDTGTQGATGNLALTEAPSNQSYSGLTVSMTYGESLVPGDLVYFKSDGTVMKADANGTGTYPVMGMALETYSSGSHLVLLNGIFRDDTRYNFTVGGLVYLSITAGGETQTQPNATDNVIQVVGIATHADRIYFNPSMDYITHV